MCGRAQAQGCGLRPGKAAGNSGGRVRALRPAEPVGSPPCTLPAPWQVKRTEGERGRERTATGRRLQPGQLARWAQGPGAALRPGRFRLGKRPGSVAGLRRPPRCSARPRSDARCALGSGGRRGEAGPSRAPPPPADRQAPPAPTPSLLLPPPGLGREGEPRGRGGDRRSAVWSHSRAGAGRTRVGQCGDPQNTGDLDRVIRAPQAGRTISLFGIDFFPPPLSGGLYKGSLVLPPVSVWR